MSRFESWCPHCRVSQPPDVKRCLNCGGRVGPGHPDLEALRPPTLEKMGRVRARLAGAAKAKAEAEVVAVEDEDEEADGRASRPFRLGLSLVWVAIALAGTLYRFCTGTG